MKRKSITFILSLFLVFVGVTACNGKQAGSNRSAEGTTAVDNGTAPIHITKADFLKKVDNYEADSKNWKYLGDKPAIIDFYADWCGPCKMVAPLLDELAKEYADKIVVYKVNVDKESGLANDFAIRSIPTIWFVPMKGKPQVVQGALSKEQLKKYIDTVLLK